MDSEPTPVVTDKRRLNEEGAVKPEVAQLDPPKPDVVMPARVRPPQIGDLRRIALSRFKVGQQMKVGPVVLKIKKVTKKDLVLRPVGMMMPKQQVDDIKQAVAASQAQESHA